MKFSGVSIQATGMARPQHFLTSDELEQKLSDVYTRLKLPFGRLELQTGIKSRGYWDAGTLPSSIAVEAAKDCLSRSSVKREEIDLLIFSSVCRDQLEPSSASSVHQQLGLSPRCQSFDLSNACLGFMSAMVQAACMIQSGAIRTALIVSGENSGPLILKTIEVLQSDLSITRKDFKKYFANLTIGSAGVAMVLTAGTEGTQLKTACSLSDTDSVHLCKGGGDTSSLMMETDSELLLHAGIALAEKTWELFTAEAGSGQYQRIISHQVGVAHRNLLYDKLKLDLTKDVATFPDYGNTGSAAVILTLHKYLTASPQSGEHLALLGIGSGLHSIMMELQCN